MKRIIYIACYFPPMGGVASIRAAKQARYLSEMGFQIDVLTVKPLWMKYPKDVSLLEGLPAGIRVWRTFLPDPNWLFKALYGLRLNSLVVWLRRNVFIPDPELVWLPFARHRLNRMFRQRTYDLALITSGPPSSLLLGPYLKRLYGIPFVCEFRDEWVNNPERTNLPQTAQAGSREREMEARVIASASGLAYLTEAMRNNFSVRYPVLASRPVAIVPNGFDEEDFKGLVPVPQTEAFHLVYTGSFYDRRQPDSLWQAILGLYDRNVIAPGQMVVDIFGKNTPGFVLGRYADNTAIRATVRFHPFLSHRESLQAMLNSAALLLYIPSGENTKSVLTGKIFDYLRSGRPIMAIVPPEGLAAELVSNASAGLIADHGDITGIQNNLLSLFRAWQNDPSHSPEPDWDYIKTYARQNLAQRLAGLLMEAGK